MSQDLCLSGQCCSAGILIKAFSLKGKTKQFLLSFWYNGSYGKSFLASKNDEEDKEVEEGRERLFFTSVYGAWGIKLP